MFILFFLFVLIALSGSVVTYFYSAKDSLLARLCAGYAIGSTFFGLVAFIIFCFFGLSTTTVLLAVLILVLPLVLLVKNDLRGKYLVNFRLAKENFTNLKIEKIFGFIFYAAILLLLYFFFERAMIETPRGIFTGGSQNLGDLPFHLGVIFGFTEGQNFPPENPSFAFAKFTYPFMTDLVAACMLTLGAQARDAMLWQNVTLGFSLVVLLENFTVKLTGNRLAGKLAPVILLFSGGLGFVIFFQDYWQDGRGIFEFLRNLPADYTIGEKGVRWGNSLTTLFLTQRSFLLGLPIALIVLTFLWETFTTEGTQKHGEEINRDGRDTGDKKTFSVFRFPFSIILVGLLAGMLPLVHVHSLAVLFIVGAFLMLCSLDKWRGWLIFALSVAIIAVPELLWAMTGSATRGSEFFGWNFGWEARGENFFVFWLKNLGIFIPLLLFAIYLVRGRKGANKDTERRTKSLLFYLPFALIFIVANLFKLAPWEWDNIKVLIYWFVGSIPFVALLLARIWEKDWAFKLIAAACLIILTFSGALDVWRVVSGQINYEVFDRDAVKIAEQIKLKTDPRALFLNAPTYNSALVLSGRRSLMRYIGHLSSYGIDYEQRERDVKTIYEGAEEAESLLQKYGIEYVLVSPEERNSLAVDENYFEKFPVAAEAGEYRVYRVKK